MPRARPLLAATAAALLLAGCTASEEPSDGGSGAPSAASPAPVDGAVRRVDDAHAVGRRAVDELGLLAARAVVVERGAEWRALNRRVEITAQIG